MPGNTEYQVEYCGLGSKLEGSSSKSGNQNFNTGRVKSEAEQPVGGRVQARYRDAVKTRSSMSASAWIGSAPITGSMGTTQPYAPQVIDSDFLATAISSENRGVHRMAPQWQDKSQPRIDSSTLYDNAERDPQHRQAQYFHRNTQINNPFSTGAQPLAVPDVHKLRYMHGEYMSHDDWY